MPDHSAVTIYRCQACGRRRPIPDQRPLAPAPRISIGCPDCDRIQPHTPQGVPA